MHHNQEQGNHLNCLQVTQYFEVSCVWMFHHLSVVNHFTKNVEHWAQNNKSNLVMSFAANSPYMILMLICFCGDEFIILLALAIISIMRFCIIMFSFSIMNYITFANINHWNFWWNKAILERRRNCELDRQVFNNGGSERSFRPIVFCVRSIKYTWITKYGLSVCHPK